MTCAHKEHEHTKQTDTCTGQAMDVLSWSWPAPHCSFELDRLVAKRCWDPSNMWAFFNPLQPVTSHDPIIKNQPLISRYHASIVAYSTSQCSHTYCTPAHTVYKKSMGCTYRRFWAETLKTSMLTLWPRFPLLLAGHGHLWGNIIIITFLSLTLLLPPLSFFFFFQYSRTPHQIFSIMAICTLFLCLFMGFFLWCVFVNKHILRPVHDWKYEKS